MESRELKLFTKGRRKIVQFWINEKYLFQSLRLYVMLLKSVRSRSVEFVVRHVSTVGDKDESG